METYESDYRAERLAREKAALSMKDMRDRIASLERDKKMFQEMLNNQAATQFQAEFAEVP